MEINPSSNVENSSQIIWAPADDHHLQFGHSVKSYRCSFCKRGFSSAQALGGHMNIHRKDRAKLKEFASDQTLLSLDITNRKDDDDEDDDDDGQGLSSLKGSTGQGSCSPEVDDSIIISLPVKDGYGDLLKLPLFAETPSSMLGEKDEEHGEVMKKLSHGAAARGEEVDLELRLGPEPYDDQPTKP